MRPARPLGATLGVAALLAILLAAVAPAQSGAPVAPPSYDFQPQLGLPAARAVVVGASPNEASGEAWAYGQLEGVPAIVGGKSYAQQLTLLERTDASGWQVVPILTADGGEALKVGAASSRMPYSLGAAAAQVTPGGGVVLMTAAGIVVRNPGGQPQLIKGPADPAGEPPAGEPPTSEPPAGQAAGGASAALLGPGESLPPQGSSGGSFTPYAATEDANGHTGLLIAPYGDGAGVSGGGAGGGGAGAGGTSGTPPSGTVPSPGVLHYDGTRWTREPIAVSSAPQSGFTPEALACGGTQAQSNASSPQNCWLLAAYQDQSSGSAVMRLALFQRRPSGDPSGFTWERETVSDWLLGAASPPAGVSGSPGVAPLGSGAQMLTVTAQGVWVDLQATLSGTSATTDVSELVLPASTPTGSAEVAGRWCFPTVASACTQSLGAPLPSQYRSFAWPGGSPQDPGTRIITGLAGRATLELAGPGDFQFMLGAGGSNGSAPGAAAFSSPQQGWIGDGVSSIEGADQQGQSQVTEITTHPQGDELQTLPVPFRFPLLAVAQSPGSAPGDPRAQAVAVGDEGQVGRYTPQAGWRPEALYDASGKVQTPTLRGVAWPEPGRAYAVGDSGSMWLWRADTGLWQPDPAKPLNFIGNLTAIAFSSTQPGLGYAVGKDGVLLKFGKTWTQEALPANLSQVNFTSVAFAGGEAIATYRQIVADPAEEGRQVEAGGLAVQDGSGWHADPAAATLLGTLADVRDTVLSKVAGLADGGAIAAGPGLVIERDGPSSPWRFSSEPLPEAQNVSALGAYRDPAGVIRAIASIDLDPNLNPDNPNFAGSLENGPFGGDIPVPTGAGEPPPFPPPDPLPDSGYVVRETATGWQDMEHMALSSVGAGQAPVDGPVRPDPVLALLVSPSGESGLAVGGQTYDSTGAHPDPSFETAAAMRFPAGGPVAGGDAPATIATAPGHATFAVGGNAACVQACRDFAAEGIGPEVWLSHALQTAVATASASPGGLRAFIYTGSSGGEDVLSRSLASYGGSLPVYAPSVDAAGSSPGSYYSVLSNGASGGPVMVIVLDYSSGAIEQAQREWLIHELGAAREHGEPAIVMGNQGVDAGLAAILVQGGASAYLFDSAEQNVRTQVTYGSAHIPAFGTGTLGYVEPPGRFESDSLGSSGFLLLDVDTTARNPSTNVAPVSAQIEPNISQVALDATDGVLLRRSQVALFDALARRPAGGNAVSDQPNGEVHLFGSEPYDPIPFQCQGSRCASAIPIDYTFASSNPDIGDFVAHEAASSNPRQVELAANGLPRPDSSSGLFCAFNSGQTTVSISAGGLTYSETVTVQGGSVQYPCGTVPLRNPPAAAAGAQSAFNAPEPPAASQPPAASPQVQGLVPPPPVVQPPHPRPSLPAPRALIPFIPLGRPLVSVNTPIVPPPAPPVARPIPPSGTSPVSQTMGAPEEKREEESATELAASKFSAYDVNERHGPGPWPLLLVLLAAGAGAGIRRGTRSNRRESRALARVRLD